MKRFMLRLVISLLLTGLLVPDRAGASVGVPFTVDVCRVESGVYRARIKAFGDDPVYAGWVLDWNIYLDFKEGDFWVYPQHAVEIVITAPEPSELIFFWIFDGGWYGAYSFYLNANTPPCSAEFGPQPGCDQFMPVGVLVTFINDTPLLWAADDRAQTGYIVQAGQSAKLIGLEADYARIVWACDTLFVRVAAMAGG